MIQNNNVGRLYVYGIHIFEDERLTLSRFKDNYNYMYGPTTYICNSYLLDAIERNMIPLSMFKEAMTDELFRK